MDYRVFGLDELVVKLHAMGGSVINALTKAVHTTGVTARDRAKAHAPVAQVQGGTLKNSISERMENGDDGVASVVYTNVPYAIYQEMGTYKMAAHPYLMPALNECKPVLDAQAKKELIKAIKGLGG